LKVGAVVGPDPYLIRETSSRLAAVHCKTKDQMADRPHRIRISDLPADYDRRVADEGADADAPSGRAVIIAFLDAASAQLEDWSPAKENARILQCEIDANAQQVFVGLIRTMSHYDEDGEWRGDTHFNLQMAFARPAEAVDSYSAIYVGEEPGTQTTDAFLAWLSAHPTAGPVLDSLPRELEVYLDGMLDETA
jgi:hypothetical protein